MANKARNKGSSYERKIAELLTQLTKKQFKKCPGSGAIGTTAKIPGLQGDIIRADLREIPYIECKKYKDFRLENFLLKQGDEWKWVQQTVSNLRGQDDRIWCIIFQKDYGRQHWLLTNFYNIRDSIDKFVISKVDGSWTLTTLDWAFKDPEFKELFTHD